MHEALKDPLKHVKEAANQDDDLDVKRNALKLLFFAEQQKHRRKENENSNGLNSTKGARIEEDLKLVDAIHKEMFTGEPHVVKNELGGKGEGGHAEQNVAEAVHRATEGEEHNAEIAGTKIRCFSCSSSIGANLRFNDQNEEVRIGGKGYLAQSSSEAQRKMLDEGKINVHTEDSKRPRSPSPAYTTADKDDPKSSKKQKT